MFHWRYVSPAVGDHPARELLEFAEVISLRLGRQRLAVVTHRRDASQHAGRDDVGPQAEAARLEHGLDPVVGCVRVLLCTSGRQQGSMEVLQV
ncbi:MAG: hypothetical protein R3C10_03965 [Pirellulales bacterium]